MNDSMQTIIELREQVRALTQALLDAQERVRLKDAIIDSLREQAAEKAGGDGDD